MTKNSKEKTIIGSLASLMAVITVITVFGVVIFKQTVDRQQKDEKAAQAVMEIQQEKSQSEEKVKSVSTLSDTVFQMPKDMKGAQVEPGREFLTELSNNIDYAEKQLLEQTNQDEPHKKTVELDPDKTMREIEKMVEDASELGLNTLLVSVNNAYGTLWNSDSPMTSFDVLGMLSDKAHEAGMSLYALYDLSLVASEDGKMSYVNSVNAQSLDQISQQLTDFATVGKVDAILLDGYLNPETKMSYYEFTKSGENVSLDAYMTQNTHLWVKNAVEAIRQSGAEIPVGLAVNPVWATEKEDPQGIPLSYTQTSLGSYHADTKAMIEQGMFDFVVVKNYGAISSDSVPFEKIADWWNKFFSQMQMPAYMSHASSKAGTWQNGWGANKELANQWEIVKGESAFSGSIFNSLEVLLKNPNYTTYHLTNLWNEKEETSESAASAQVQGDTFSAQVKGGSYSDLDDRYAGSKISNGTLVRVTSEQALTFPLNKNTIYPDIKCYPMPNGTMDYVVGDQVRIHDGTRYRYYYKLASGRRVYCEDVEAVRGGGSIKQNRITDMTVKANNQFTYIILKSDYPVAYLPDYSSSRMKFEFQNTVSTPGNLQLNQNPLFSGAYWNGSTLELEFLNKNVFLGYKGYHENGNIVLRFNNPTGIQGARIVIDPGHGGSDPGVADNIDPNWPEKRVNWELSKEIANALEEKGAQVKLLQTYDRTTSLDSRLAQARNFDASMFLSIHTNSSETNPGASGSEFYYFYPFSKSLAARMSEASSSGLSTNDRGAKYDVFYLNRDPQFISVLGEVGFLTHPSEYKKMKQDSYQREVGREIANAAEKYFNSGTEYAGRTGVQSTGETLNSTDGPSSNTQSSGEPSKNHSSSVNSGNGSQNNSQANSSNKAPKKETVISDGKKTGKVKYIIFTDPENKKLNMEVGEDKKLGIRITGDSEVRRKYTTSNKHVATIDKNGVVTAVGAGSCKITVVAGDQGGTIEVKVTDGKGSSSSNRPSGNTNKQNNGLESSNGGYIPTTGIKIRTSHNRVQAGQSLQMEVVFYPSNATGQNIIWSISRGKLYGSVDGRGVFTGIESGFATVKATTADGAYSATYRIEIM